MTVRIDIKGPIISNDEAWIYDLFEMDATNPRKVIDALEDAKGEDVIISINSPGGYVYDGSEIYTALKNYSGYVEAQVVGLAASAASVIAMGADKVRISPTAKIMIHNASMVGMGDHRDFTKAAERLKVTDRTIVNAYVIKSGKSEEELLNMMAEETWMGPQEALDNNLIDEIMFTDNTVKIAASSNSPNLIPQKVIDGIRNKVMNEKKTKTNNESISKEIIEQMFTDFKQEIINEIKPTEKTEHPAEPEAKEKQNNTSTKGSQKAAFFNL